ncbi:MAG TPA: sugar transferase [Syntrophorhabdaceae bacterium]|nr:sugar transferase [Syntrophorhabdaceae bacterium]
MLKRSFDLLFVLLLLIVLCIPMAVISLIILKTMGRPVLFRQIRPGYKGKPFMIMKFRTMNDARDPEGQLLPDEFRLTKFGKNLRRLSLDELPQLFNVLKGELSFVGPRPLLMEYLPLYTERQARRHDVKPGITGWTQVNGRNALTWEEKFEFDIWYVDNRSFFLDMKILWMTIVKVIQREGITAEGSATMPEFKGSETDQGDK